MTDGGALVYDVGNCDWCRIKIEQNYAKELQHLVKSQKPCTDSGYVTLSCRDACRAVHSVLARPLTAMCVVHSAQSRPPNASM